MHNNTNISARNVVCLEQLSIYYFQLDLHTLHGAGSIQSDDFQFVTERDQSLGPVLFGVIAEDTAKNGSRSN